MDKQVQTRFLGVAVILLLSTSLIRAQSAAVTFQRLDGSSFNLAERKGHPVVLLFTASWSPLAEKALPTFQKIADRHMRGNTEFYWVSLDKSLPGERHYASDADLQAFVQRRRLRIKVLRDPDLTAFRAFGLEVIPTVVIINRAGEVDSKHIGFSPNRPVTWNRISKALFRLSQ